MANYVMLLKFTDQGIRNVKDTTKRAAAFSEAASKMGAKINNILWTLGQYDLVAMAEAPNDETIAALALTVGKLGNVSIQTLRGFTSSEVDGILTKVGGAKIGGI
jgi:uncharacterized protein with GYD domain